MKRYSISISWNIEDILSLDSSLSRDECVQVLNMALKNHDSNIGINWEFLTDCITQFKQKNLTHTKRITNGKG